MRNYELKNVDPDDIDEVLAKVEKSFDINFSNKELIYITTFDELCDHIANKIELASSDDCTSQQAFYKLRNAVSSTLQIDNSKISTDASLTNLFPIKGRRSSVKNLEGCLGFKLNILRPPHWLTGTLGIILLTSFILVFFNWKIGLLLVVSVGGLWIANKIGNEFDVQTVGQVVERMTRENYLKSRRNSKTFNKNEIEKVLTDWFSSDLYIDTSKLKREAKFS